MGAYAILLNATGQTQHAAAIHGSITTLWYASIDLILVASDFCFFTDNSELLVKSSARRWTLSSSV